MSRSGLQAQLHQRVGLQQRGRSGSSSASMPASEKGCTGSRWWPSTSAGVWKVRRSLRWGAMRPKNSPCSSAPPGPGSWRIEVEQDVAVVGKQPSRHGARGPREQLHHRLAERERDEQRREGERAPQQRVVEHRHLDHHPAQPLGRHRGDLERRVGAQRGAHHDRLLDLQMVHQRDHLLAEEAHRVAPHVARAVGFAVAEQVDRDHAVAARREVFGQRPVHLLGEQQPVDEDQRPRGRRRALAVRPRAPSAVTAAGPPPNSV